MIFIILVYISFCSIFFPYQDNKDGAEFSFEIIEIESSEENEDDESRHQIIDEIPT